MTEPISYRGRLDRIRSLALWGSTLLPAGFVVFLLLARWPEYWKWINFEDTPMTSLQVSVMYTSALVACAAGSHAWLEARKECVDWWLLAVAFLYFAMDDRFAIHERIRDNILAPHGIRIPFLPWVGPGDFILLIYAVVGLLMLPRLLRVFRGNHAATVRFLTAVGVAGVAVLLDSIELKRLPVEWQRLEQTVEECLELTAQVLLLQSFIVAWFSRLSAWTSDASPLQQS